jgi:hypothetical protein
LASLVGRGVGNLAQTVQKPKHLKDRCVNPYPDRVIAALHSLQRGTRGHRTLGNLHHGQIAPKAGFTDVRTQAL